MYCWNRENLKVGAKTESHKNNIEFTEYIVFKQQELRCIGLNKCYNCHLSAHKYRCFEF